MKRIIVSLLLFLLSSRFVFAQESGWTVDNFNATVEIDSDGQVAVTETITVNFVTDKHGIIRTIPVDYLDQYKNRRSINLQLNNVSMDNRDVNYQSTKTGSNFEIKIGDPDNTIKGVHQYQIRYSINRSFNYFPQHDEWYWNVTGNEWPVGINQAQVTVIGKLQPNQIACYTGHYASGDSACQIEPDSSDTIITGLSPLSPGENLSIILGFDKGQIIIPSSTQRLWWRLQDNWGYFLPVVTLLILIWLYLTNGRDNYYVNHFDSKNGEKAVPLLAQTIIGDVYYPPKSIQAAEAGLLIDEKVGKQDIAAVLIQLANKACLKIEPKDKRDYTFIKGQGRSDLNDYEQEFLSGLFASRDMVNLSDLKYEFTSHAQKVKSGLYDWSVKQGFFVARPDRIRSIYTGLGAVAAIAGISLAGMGSESMIGTSPGIGLTLSGFMIALASFSMPKRTAKGRQALLEILGLKRVIQLGAYRQEIFEKHNYFNEILPYAIAFGLTKQWAKAVEKLQLEKPDWYQSTQTFSAIDFGRSMSILSSTASNNMTAVRSTTASTGKSGFSSGGGFSGGGFGGGGGRSW